MYCKKIGLIVLIALLSGIGSGYFEIPNPIHILTSKTLAQTPKPSQSEAQLLVDQGIEQAEKSQFDAAIKSWQSALILYKELDDRFSQGALLNYIGLAYRNSGQYQKALVYLQQALDLLTTVQDRAGIGTTWNNIGLVYSSLNRHKDALKAYQQALAIKKEFDDRRGQATLLNNIGTAYRNLSEYNEALNSYHQALTLFKSVLDKSGEGTTLNNIGGVYNNLGQYFQALTVYKHALELLQSVNDKAGEGTTLNNIGVLYRNLGQYDKALKYYKQALDIINKLGKRALIATTLNNIGEIYDSKGKYEEALSQYQQALNIRQQIQDKAGEGTTLNSIGAAYRNLHQYQEALKVYQQALVIRKEVGDERGKATTLNNLGNVYLDLHQSAEALKVYQQALLISEKVGDKPNLGNTLSNIGSAYLQEKNSVQAISTLYKALDVLDFLRSSKLIDADKVALFETQDYTYRLLQKALITQNKIKEALEIAERGRARAFVEILSKRVSPTSNAQPSISPLSIKQIQQIAQAEKATLVEYSIISKQELIIWVIKPTGQIDVRQVDLKSLNTSLQDFVVISRTVIGARGRGSIGVAPPPDNSSTQRLHQLHQILIEPIANLLPTDPKARVIFLPHKSLFLIPFVALQDVKGKYLIEKHTILTAPAIQVLDLTRKRRQQVSGKGALIVGNPKIQPQVREEYNLVQLEGAEKEAIEIAKIFNTKALISNQPTKAAILRRMPTARIIHLATHGLLDDIKKLGIPGAIVLAPDGRDNGLLTAEEILDLKLNAELVVLSACNTAQGNLTGDGVIGLSRSLITSGAPSVIVTLWKIPDYPSFLLMTEFYQNLKRNSDKATALRSAMLTTMKKYPNPIDWAAFTLIGEAQ